MFASLPSPGEASFAEVSFGTETLPWLSSWEGGGVVVFEAAVVEVESLVLDTELDAGGCLDFTQVKQT